MVEFLRRGGPDDHHAQRVANEIAGFAVAQELRIAGENPAFLGSIHVVLKGHDAGPLDIGEYFVEHPQVDEEPFPAPRRAEGIARSGEHFSNQRGRVGDEDGSGGRTHHNQHFSRLQEDPGIPFFEQVAPEDGREYRDNSDKGKHKNGMGSRRYTSMISYRRVWQEYEITQSDLLAGRPAIPRNMPRRYAPRSRK